MAEAQQGVAQRVLDGMATMSGGVEGHRYAGAKTLEMNLSAEARAILAELEEESRRNELWQEINPCLFRVQREMRQAFDRLGLDLEGEDS